MSEAAMPDFVAGFAGRHAVMGEALARAFAPPPGFAAADPRQPMRRSTDGPAAPRHFSPAAAASHSAGFADPVAAAHAAGYAEGLAAAAAIERDADAGDRVLAAELAAALGDGSRFDREAVADALRHTVMLLVTKLIGEVGVSAELMAKRVEAASAMLADKAESALLRVHPDDVAALGSVLPASVFAVGDAAVDRGSFVLESASTVVEDGPRLWLEELASAIERVPLPGRC